ncbi:nucleoplasmin-like protein [Perkinsela sp. CCAP 1560/4]|nr:nucleoplasmin-like protein [Perkinsela sp. CCAP 1560/4]|eukprot:KNH09117.1 nucleoplasmin-like protein [Perkinsela sp. CCAP 1560/4]
MQDHGLALISCIFYFTGIKSENSFALANLIEILQVFQISLTITPIEDNDSKASIYEVLLSHKDINIFDHKILVSLKPGETPLNGDSSGEHPALQELKHYILRILYCLCKASERMNRYYTTLFEDLAFINAMENTPDLEVIAKVKRHCFILHFCSNRDLYTSEFLDLAKLSGLDMSSRAIDNSRRLMYSRLVKSPIMDETLVRKFDSMGIGKEILSQNIDLLWWLCEVSTAEVTSDDMQLTKDHHFMLEKLCVAYDRSESGFNSSEPESVMPYASMLFFEYLTPKNRLNAALGKTLLFNSRKRPYCKQNITTKRTFQRGQIAALFTETKSAKKSTKITVREEESPPVKMLVDELSVANRKGLPQIDFTSKTLRLPSPEFEAILHIWFFLYSVPRKVKLTRTDLDVFIQAVMSDADTRIVQDAVRGLLFLLGHKFSSSVNQGGYFRVSVRANVIAEAVTVLKKLASTGGEEALSAKTQSFCRSMKSFGWNLYWSRLSIAQRIELFELLCTHALRAPETCEYFEDMYKHHETIGGLSMCRLNELLIQSQKTDDALTFICPLGLDRYRRIYWKFPTDSRIFVQVTENSMEWNADEQFVLPAPAQPRPSVILDDEEEESVEEEPASSMVKILGWGTIAAESVHFLVSSLVPNGVNESFLLENLNTVLKLATEADITAEGEEETLEYPLTRSRVLSPLQKYENLLY